LDLQNDFPLRLLLQGFQLFQAFTGEDDGFSPLFKGNGSYIFLFSCGVFKPVQEVLLFIQQRFHLPDGDYRVHNHPVNFFALTPVLPHFHVLFELFIL